MPFSSTSTSPLQPSHFLLRSVEIFLVSSEVRVLRCLISSLSTKPSLMCQAGVLGRAKNLEMLVMSGWVFFRRVRVLLKAWVVSPGKPTMISVARVKLGNCSRKVWVIVWKSFAV